MDFNNTEDFNRGSQDRLEKSIEQAIMRSFSERGGRMTANEVARRFKICESAVMALRVDVGWSVQRICDHLYQFLISQLDGTHFEPSRKTRWGIRDFPNDVVVLHERCGKRSRYPGPQKAAYQNVEGMSWCEACKMFYPRGEFKEC